MFEYNIGNQVKVNTQPFQVNQKPDLRAAKAIESVNKMVQAGAKAYNTYQQEKDTTSFYEASKEAREVQSWYDNTISSTNDAYEKESILNQYKIAMDSISQGYELEDKYREAYANAYDSFLSSQQRAIGAAVTQRKISDTTKVINDISLSLVNGDAELSIPIIKESIKELSTLVDTDEAESSVINMFIGNRINNIIKDKDKILEKDIKQVKSDLATFIKKAAPKLTGKELDVKLNTTLQTLIKAQKETATAKMNNLLISEATTQKMFEKELDKYPHIFEKIEIANFKEKKANNVYNLKIANQTRSEAATKELNEVFLATHKALIDNPTATREEIIASYDDALKRKIYKSPEEMKNRLEKTLFDLETKKSSKANKEAEEKAKIAKGVIDDLKTRSSYKGGMDPKEVQNYIGIKNKGNPFTKEDINWLNDYTGQYNMENNLEFANNIVKNTSTMYIGTPLEKGIKKGLTNIVNSSYTPQDFSASNILTIFNNHNIKGDIPTLITNDMNKIDTVPMALSRFEELKSYDKDLTKKLLGDKKYNLFKAMGTRLTVKDGNPYIAPDDYRKVMDIYNNPDKYPVDLTDFNEALKDDPNLFDKVEEYKTKVRFGTDTDDAVEEIQNEVSNTIPTEGVDLRGYSYNLTEDDTNILEDVVEYIKEVNPDFVGISYNPQDKLFYYSSKYDKYAAPVVTTSFDEEGNRQETSYSKFEGVDGMLFNVKNNMTKYYKENPKFLDQIINSYERKGKSLYYLYKDNIVPPVQEYIVDPLKRADEYIHNLSKDIKQWETETYDDIQEWKKDLYDRTFGNKSGLQAADLPINTEGNNVTPNYQEYSTILEDIRVAETGTNTYEEGVLHVGQETITADNPNGTANTTRYGVVVTDFPKQADESDYDHAKRYYKTKVEPQLKKLTGIETESQDIVTKLASLAWNRGTLPKIDLNNEEKSRASILDVTTTGRKQSNGVINRSLTSYKAIADIKGWKQVAYVETPTTKDEDTYKIEFFDKDNKLLYSDKQSYKTAPGSRIAPDKRYEVKTMGDKEEIIISSATKISNILKEDLNGDYVSRKLDSGAAVSEMKSFIIDQLDQLPDSGVRQLVNAVGGFGDEMTLEEVDALLKESQQ